LETDFTQIIPELMQRVLTVHDKRQTCYVEGRQFTVNRGDGPKQPDGQALPQPSFAQSKKQAFLVRSLLAYGCQLLSAFLLPSTFGQFADLVVVNLERQVVAETPQRLVEPDVDLPQESVPLFGEALLYW